MYSTFSLLPLPQQLYARKDWGFWVFGENTGWDVIAQYLRRVEPWQRPAWGCCDQLRQQAETERPAQCGSCEWASAVGHWEPSEGVSGYGTWKPCWVHGFLIFFNKTAASRLWGESALVCVLDISSSLNLYPNDNFSKIWDKNTG